MKPFTFFLVFLIVLGSASATFPITINGKDVPNSPTTADIRETDQIDIFYQGKAQGFTSPIDDEIAEQTKGSIVFKRNSKAPPISQFFFFETNGVIVSQPSNSPTGALVYQEESTDNKGIAITVILFLSITGLAFLLISASKMRALFVAIIILILAFTAFNLPKKEPTGFAIQEFEPQEITPQTHISKPFTLTWTHGGPVTFFPEEADGEEPECSDGIDNTDFEDALIDFPADPGCSGPDDDLELDMLEYDHTPVVDNQIDAYDIVNWIQYFNGDFSVLVDCTDAACSNNPGTNCVGDVDPSGNLVLNAADITFLQQQQLDDDNSVTDGICFNT
jgi:hypothetical protein